ncbi:MAG: homocysteine S-methyltransferase family protein [Clostridiales bacterium]|jgi:5-methyltetrahydrofolate--homocysteine methyltransferase|nr:homocysteine S-methyltransferase family protein [Clostridiales bacterium]
MDILNHIKDSFLLFDGAMGTMLASGRAPAGLPEVFNIERPEIVTRIHKQYLEAGADIITANTFGARANKLKKSGISVQEAVKAGIACARAAGAETVALDVGPLGELMEPMGAITFEEAYGLFKEEIIAGRDYGADLILLETFFDPLEAKTAILAAKENSSLPVFCTMTFQQGGRTFIGTDPKTAVITLQALGADAFGVNCSQGPETLLDVVQEILKYAKRPVIVQPNAGAPRIMDGQTVYDIDINEFVSAMEKMVSQGVRIIGGCCGTTPDYIAALRGMLRGRTVKPIQPLIISAATSAVKTVELDGHITVIGERLNPTCNKAVEETLRENQTDGLADEAIDQAQAGADLLDINVGLPDIDQADMMRRAVKAVAGAVNLPLLIDSADPAVLEAGARVYGGRPVINSVNGTEEAMNKIFPIVKKYGAMVVCLTFGDGTGRDKEDIPVTAQRRFEIARKILARALEYGIPKEDIIIDCLALPAGAYPAQAAETLDAVRMVKALGLKTALGISNVSFGAGLGGQPGLRRETLNAAFVSAALAAGLDAPILNPLSGPVMDAVNAMRALNNGCAWSVLRHV